MGIWRLIALKFALGTYTGASEMSFLRCEFKFEILLFLNLSKEDSWFEVSREVGVPNPTELRFACDWDSDRIGFDCFCADRVLDGPWVSFLNFEEGDMDLGELRFRSRETLFFIKNDTKTVIMPSDSFEYFSVLARRSFCASLSWASSRLQEVFKCLISSSRAFRSTLRLWDSLREALPQEVFLFLPGVGENPEIILKYLINK